MTGRGSYRYAPPNNNSVLFIVDADTREEADAKAEEIHPGSEYRGWIGEPVEGKPNPYVCAICDEDAPQGHGICVKCAELEA